MVGIETPEVHTDDEKTVQNARYIARVLFRAFQEDNQQFNFQPVIRDGDGYEVFCLADYGIEDVYEGGWYPVFVSAYLEKQPTDDEEKVRESDAFQTAREILEAGIGEIHEAPRYGFRPEQLRPETSSGPAVEARYPVAYGKDNHD